MYVAAGSNNLYGTSTSGLPNNWDISKGLPSSAVPTGLAFGGGRFIMVTNAAFYSSTDPRTGNWTAVATSLPATGPWTITYGNGRFMAVTPTSSGKYMTSTDGVTWTSGNVGIAVTRIAFAASKFVAIVGGLGGTAAASTTDGTTWTAVTLPSPGSTASWNNITAAANTFFVTGSNTTSANAIRSQNGEVWVTPTLGTPSVWRLAVSGGGVTYLIPMNAPSARASLDGGITWLTHGTLTSAPWNAAVADATGVITVVGDNGWVMSST
jgi:hypothetical protein